MVCCLFGAKPSPEDQLVLSWIIKKKHQWKFKYITFFTKSTYRLPNGIYFGETSVFLFWWHFRVLNQRCPCFCLFVFVFVFCVSWINLCRIYALLNWVIVELDNDSSLSNYHYYDVIMSAIASQITSLMIVCSAVYSAQIKEHIKAPRHWPLCAEFTGNRWIPFTNDQLCGNVSIWWRHHVETNADVSLITPYGTAFERND